MDAPNFTRWLVSLLISGLVFSAAAQTIGTIKTTDFEDTKPKVDLPNSKTLEMDLKKFKNATGQIILRQFPNRVRIEFEASRLPHGTYTLAKSDSCVKTASVAAARYKSGWSELARFKSDQAHLATEKSIAKATLADLQGKSVSLFKVSQDKYEFIDCKPVE